MSQFIIYQTENGRTKLDVRLEDNTLWLNLVEPYLIFAQSQAERRVPMTMQDWITKLEGFLTLNDREILQNAGKVSAGLAKSHAELEFEKYREREDRALESDFDLLMKQLPPPPKP